MQTQRSPLPGVAFVGTLLALCTTSGCGPSWRELAQQGRYLDASMRMQQVAPHDWKQGHEFAGLLRRRTAARCRSTPSPRLS